MHAQGGFRCVARRYGVAVLAVAVATVARLGLDQAFGSHLSTTTYFIAVLFAARFGGMGPSAVALLLGFILADLLFIPPRWELFGYSWGRQFELCLYFSLGGLTVVLSGSLYSARVKAQSETRDALDGQLRLQEEIEHRLAIEGALRESEHRYRVVAEQLRAADRRKDEFLAMLGHELRNPLAPIASAVNLLQLGDVEPAMQSECYDVMQRHLSQLSRIVDDLLDVSRIMQGKISLRPEQVDVRKIVAESVEACGPLMSQFGHELLTTIPEDPAPVHADPVRLTQVVVNLLNNAAKYTPPHGRIEVRLLVQANGMLLEVTDNGMGIDSSILPKVFELFTQADRSLDRSAGGLGIGLTVVKSLVEMHGGSVSAASKGVGKGSTFSIRLPLSAASSERLDSKPSTAFSTPLRVLVIEDNAGAAQMLAALLARVWGHHVKIAQEGFSGLEIARSEQFDVIFVDIGLPGLNGYDVARQLRRNRSADEAVLVALTGYGQEEDRALSRAAGFDLHLIKPASIDSLEEVFAHPKVGMNTPDPVPLEQ